MPNWLRHSNRAPLSFKLLFFIRLTVKLTDQLASNSTNFSTVHLESAAAHETGKAEVSTDIATQAWSIKLAVIVVITYCNYIARLH